jgi:hypothetical protein
MTKKIKKSIDLDHIQILHGKNQCNWNLDFLLYFVHSFVYIIKYVKYISIFWWLLSLPWIMDSSSQLHHSNGSTDLEHIYLSKEKLLKFLVGQQIYFKTSFLFWILFWIFFFWTIKILYVIFEVKSNLKIGGECSGVENVTVENVPEWRMFRGGEYSPTRIIDCCFFIQDSRYIFFYLCIIN